MHGAARDRLGYFVALEAAETFLACCLTHCKQSEAHRYRAESTTSPTISRGRPGMTGRTMPRAPSPTSTHPAAVRHGVPGFSGLVSHPGRFIRYRLFPAANVRFNRAPDPYLAARPLSARACPAITSLGPRGTGRCRSSFARRPRPPFPADTFQSSPAPRSVRRSAACPRNRPPFPPPTLESFCFP
jgi:hypothetical protein